MSIDGAMPWFEVSDPEQREALAGRVAGEMESLSRHPGYKRVMYEIQEQIESRIEQLIAGKEMDRTRGIVSALQTVTNLPQRIHDAADKELDRHRGKA